MDTLSRAITARVFPNPADYHALRQHWSSLVISARRHELTAAHHVLYLALLGKDWRKAFTPVTNPRKLANGAFVGWPLFSSLRTLHSELCNEYLLAPFDGLVTVEMLNAVRRYLPAPNPYQYRPEAFSRGSFPLDAYLEPVESPRDA
ncbi:MAG TPA: hypothetical protein VFR15_05595 [Chloroflexia bacterium]|nr:hypothetical protein [Chloroflexia bacterium]